MREQIQRDFKQNFGREPELFVRAPGRVNILGGHVDYSEGWVLPGAIEQSLWLAVGRRDDRVWRIRALDVDDQRSADLGSSLAPLAERQAADPRAVAEWVDYPLGVAWVMDGGSRSCPFSFASRDLRVPGLDVVMSSELPIGGGVSSSAAVEMAFVLAVEHVLGQSISGVDKARIGLAVENEYLGVQSGIMDQYASIHGKANTLVLIDCRHLEHREIPFPERLRVLVADSKVRRRLVGSDFNSRRGQCEEAVAILQQTRPEIRTLRDVAPADFESLVGLLPEPLDRRARHAVFEMARVLEGGEALERGDIKTLGDAMKRSHESSRDLYEVTIPELDHLAELAWETDGCHGARLAGGGFGGCILALVEADATARLRDALTAGYQERFGLEPGFLETSIAAGAEVIEV